MTTPCISLPFDAAMRLPKDVLLALVNPDRLLLLLQELGPDRGAWLLGAPVSQVDEPLEETPADVTDETVEAWLFKAGPQTIPQLASHFVVSVDVIRRCLNRGIEIVSGAGDDLSTVYRSLRWNAPKTSSSAAGAGTTKRRNPPTSRPAEGSKEPGTSSPHRDPLLVVDALFDRPRGRSTPELRAASPPKVSSEDLQAVFNAMTDRKGGHMKGGEAFYMKSLDSIATAAGMVLSKTKRALEILKGNGRCFEQEGMFFRDSGPATDVEVDVDQNDEDEATAPTDRAPAPLTTDQVLELLKANPDAPLDIDQMAARLDRTAKEVREVVAILIKHPKRITSADGDGRWALFGEPPASKLNGASKRRAKGEQLTVPGA